MRRFHFLTIFAFFMLGLMPCMTSCRQKDLLFPEAGTGVLEVRFEWQERSTDAPDGMTLYFFPLDDEGMLWRFDIAGRSGGPVELPYGEYAMISFNNDVAGIRISDPISPEILEARLRETDGMTQSITPLYRAHVEKVSFSPAGVSWNEGPTSSQSQGPDPTMTCHPSKVSTSYEVEVPDIEGCDKVMKASLTFHGVCSSLLMSDALSAGSVIDLSSSLVQLPTTNTLTSEFESFGPLQDKEEASIVITVTLKDALTYRKTFSLADQLANIKDRFYVKFIIKGLSIPDIGQPPESDVGMTVDVDGWTAVNVDYITGP